MQVYAGSTGSGGIYGLGIDFYFADKFIAGADFSTAYVKAVRLPYDYDAGLSLIPNRINPRDNMLSANLVTGVYLSSEKTNLRLSLEGGAGFRQYGEKQFKRKSRRYGELYVGPNYDLDMKYYKSTGCLLQTSMQLCMSSHFGMGISGQVDLSRFGILPSYKISILAGNLRK